MPLQTFFDYFKGIKGSPKTTITGVTFMIVSVALYFFQEDSIALNSVEAILFGIGLILFFKSDHDKGTKVK